MISNKIEWHYFVDLICFLVLFDKIPKFCVVQWCLVRYTIDETTIKLK